MRKEEISTLNSVKSYTFKTQESYSPEEIFAAGGTTAFAIKIGKRAKISKTALKMPQKRILRMRSGILFKNN